MNRSKVLRTILMVIGLLFLGIGTCFLRKAGFGIDPFTGFNLAVSTYFGMGLAVFQAGVNIILLIIVLICDKKYFGVGTVTNMFGMGILIQYLYPWLDAMTGSSLGIGPRIVWMSVGIVTACLGVALYVEMNLGAAPYDALGYVIEEMSRGKISFRVGRILMDFSCAALCYAFGGVIGAGTLIMALFTGPVVQFFRDNLERYVMPRVVKVEAVK